MKQSGFNPKARWDRHIPERPQYNSESLNERIDVLAFFNASKIYPRIFIWNNKKYKIKTITYTWQERKGQKLINFFSVNTGSDLYQISFNNTTFGWKIDKIIE
ncbi:MAG: hypothetical protein NTW64_02690 [Candidatus Omnitrophica bacterium]|nr:hypothetical protein [Candidatus Omnitrophota bacterium]